MKVLDLRCSGQHAFEGWFASNDDYEAQLSRGLLECPMCGDRAIVKLPSAPRLNFGAAAPEPRRVPGGGRESAAASVSSASAGAGAGAQPSSAHAQPAPGGVQHRQQAPADDRAFPRAMLDAASDAPDAAAQARWLGAMRQLLARTEDVGDRFPDEARRIHHGEAPERAIRGHATPQQTEALREEGIEVMALAVPAALKETLQ